MCLFIHRKGQQSPKETPYPVPHSQTNGNSMGSGHPPVMVGTHLQEENICALHTRVQQLCSRHFVGLSSPHDLRAPGKHAHARTKVPWDCTLQQGPAVANITGMYLFTRVMLNLRAMSITRSQYSCARALMCSEDHRNSTLDRSMPQALHVCQHTHIAAKRPTHKEHTHLQGY